MFEQDWIYIEQPDIFRYSELLLKVVYDEPFSCYHRIYS